MEDLLYKILTIAYNIAHVEIRFSLSMFIPFMCLWSYVILKVFR